MKKEYLIGLLTGCLLTASALIFMGAIDNDSQIGKYQMSHSNEEIRLIDTRNGQQYIWGWVLDEWIVAGDPLED